MVLLLVLLVRIEELRLLARTDLRYDFQNLLYP